MDFTIQACNKTQNKMFFCRVKQLPTPLLLFYATLNSLILYTVFSYRTRSYEHNINKTAALDRIMLIAKFVYMCVFQKRFSSPPEYSESLGYTWRIITCCAESEGRLLLMKMCERYPAEISDLPTCVWCVSANNKAVRDDWV